ncbi:MAG: IS66 family transposase [Planctomycetes bacterium]|nr:IS66 family transposase [Planctomycetota bacterium]NOG82439.1 IS66 family transposase [Planctomycetota bacterium]NOG84272.1 IS66 family transposase [Planctomycetota bacterium]NOG84296.1 IS66 family transposase [Planctomycetota bacterium]NOG84952.1 IS66 family transposase [Planctomycetota bacterium]
MRINKTTIESTLKQVEDQLKDNKELPSDVQLLFKLLVLIIKVLVDRIPKKKAPKDKEKPGKEDASIKELLDATGERTKLEKLQEENERLKAELDGLKIQAVNRESNKPSSKQPEWEAKGVGNDQKGDRRGRGKKKRNGAGNKRKTKEPTIKAKEKLVCCTNCGKDLSRVVPLKDSNTRIIEDISEVSEPEVIEVEQEKKYCPGCQQVVTAKSELALPKSDIGLNLTTLICYLWVSLGIPFTRLSRYLKDFFLFEITTSGLSHHVMRVSKIFEDVYEEILQDVQTGCTLFADETGWRIKGNLWWLWVFGTEHSAYFSIDKSRGSDVVLRILGEIFPGVMVVDGWGAYTSIISDQQSCMAHLLRKIRKFYAKFPELKDIARFYVKFRRIIRDGERLQGFRKEYGEEKFLRRFARLETRLEELLRWPNPDNILQSIIDKVRRQQPRILTFVRHPGVPCHNNFAEYLIRIGVLKRKISGGSKSEEGAKAYAVLLSIFTTCKLRKIPFLRFIRESLKHYIRTGKPLLLKEFVEVETLKKAAKLL